VAKVGFRDGVENWALLLLRVGAGLMLAILHGWSKIQGAYGMLADGEAWKHVDTVIKIGLPAPKIMAVCSALAEFLGGILLAVGFLTPLGAAAVAINMGVAVGLHLSGDMRLELAAMYLLVAVYVMVRGGGRFSIDGVIWRK
jgi:putative oxidoreductase